MKAIVLFVLAGLAEIGGGYLVWLSIREGKPVVWGIAGGLILALYGVIAALQAFPSFGRVYAAYGGVFIMMSIVWGWLVDKRAPDRYDWIGALVCIIGAAIILWVPRNQ